MKVPARARARVFLRSLFLQASWNTQGMQNLGFAWAIAPALEVLYPDPKARAAAGARHLEFFNCHPYAAAAILGAAVRLEEEIAAGAQGPAASTALKKALGPPFAALGDGFFWLALRPLASLLGVCGALVWRAPGAFLLLFAYDLVHLPARVWLFQRGYDQGPGVVEAVQRLRVPRATALLKLGAAALLGGFAALLLRGAAVEHGLALSLSTAAAAAAAWALLPRVRMGTLVALAAVAGLALGGRFH